VSLRTLQKAAVATKRPGWLGGGWPPNRSSPSLMLGSLLITNGSRTSASCVAGWIQEVQGERLAAQRQLARSVPPSRASAGSSFGASSRWSRGSPRALGSDSRHSSRWEDPTSEGTRRGAGVDDLRQLLLCPFRGDHRVHPSMRRPWYFWRNVDRKVRDHMVTRGSEKAHYLQQRAPLGTCCPPSPGGNRE
jgi:hypothetical protein